MIVGFISAVGGNDKVTQFGKELESWKTGL